LTYLLARQPPGATLFPYTTLFRSKPRLGPEFTMRFNEYRSAQINGSAAPGYSADQATAALEDVFRKTMPREMGFDYSGMSFQERSEEHTSELQSRFDLVCRLLLEK